MNLKEQITGNPYNYDKVARCELDRVMKEDSMLRTKVYLFYYFVCFVSKV